MVLFSSDSVDSSGYGSLYSKFGSTTSASSVTLPSQVNNSDVTEEKNRSRSVSSISGYFLVFGYEKQQAISTKTAVDEVETDHRLVMSHAGHFAL